MHIWFKDISNACLFFFTVTWRINPVVSNNKPTINNIPLTTNVGILGTNPVLKYSEKTGTANIIDIIKTINAIILKNNAGLYSLNNVPIVF